MRSWPLLVAAALLSRAASAGELELSAHVGPTFPFYEQAFEFDPGILAGLPANVSVEQEDIFRLDARGGLALGAAASYQFSPWLGLEARLDTADVRVRITGARYLIRVDLPTPLPDLASELDLSSGDANLHRIHPVSLNLRARSAGRTRIGVSAGLSYLPSFRFQITQGVRLQPREPLPLPPTSAVVTLPAEALPGEKDQGRLGVNAGLFVQVRINERVALQAEGRYFHFRKQTLSWGTPEIEPRLPVVEQTIVEEIAGRLDPAEFNPTFFELTAGLTVRF
jgi:hypothetical protein